MFEGRRTPGTRREGFPGAELIDGNANVTPIAVGDSGKLPTPSLLLKHKPCLPILLQVQVTILQRFAQNPNPKSNRSQVSYTWSPGGFHKRYGSSE
jgi:hypothetical protein